jgi:DNA-binding MarR family transcriptional regulator
MDRVFVVTRTSDKVTGGTRVVLHDHIVARINRLADAMVRMSARNIRRRWNLRATDFRILNILENGVSLSVNEIGRRALLDQAWISRTLRTLEAAKLVEKSNDPRDSRLTLVKLSRKGREILNEFRPYARWSEKLLLKDVNGEALKALLDQLEVNTAALLDTFENLPQPKRKKPSAK